MKNSSNRTTGIWLLGAVAFAFCLAALPVRVAQAAEELEMDVITVYGKETYRIRKEVFQLLAPMKREQIQMMKIKKRAAEPVPPPELGRPEVSPYDAPFEIRPSGEIADISVVRTGVLLYFMMPRARIENLHLEFVSTDGVTQEFYLKQVQKDQYIEANLAPGRYRLRFEAEGMESAAVDTLVVREGQISLAILPVQEKIAPPPPPVVEAPPPPPPPETKLSVQLVPLRKVYQLPSVQPTMVTKGKLRLKEKGVANAQIRLYEGEVGFFDPYDPNVENALLAVTVTDEAGNFEFPPIDNVDGIMEGTRDPVLVLALENRSVSVLKPLPLTKSVTYRYVVYKRSNVQPDAGNLDVGTVDVKLPKDMPVMLFESVCQKSATLRAPIQIFFPSGSAFHFASRTLHVPQKSTIPQVLEYLDYLSP